MDERLLREYRETRYLADDGTEIRIGQRPAALGARAWAFVTAANPRSDPRPAAENEERNVRLEERLRALKLPYVRGRGIGRTGWEEPSFLVLDVARDVAVALGRAFEQNAIVVGKDGGEAELVLLGET